MQNGMQQLEDGAKGKFVTWRVIKHWSKVFGVVVDPLSVGVIKARISKNPRAVGL